jgi:hypothetical protein
MAEPIKGRKLTLREIMDEIADDEEIDPEQREMALEKVREIEYQDWCERQIKAGR